MAYNPYTGRWEMDGAQQVQMQPLPRPQPAQMQVQPPKLGVLTVASEASINNLQMQPNDNALALPCTLRKVTLPATGNTEIHTETDLALSGCCCCVNHTFTLVATTDTTAAGSVVELCTGLLKLA